jgi:hypothetical protein
VGSSSGQGGLDGITGDVEAGASEAARAAEVERRNLVFPIFRRVPGNRHRPVMAGPK